MCNAVLCGTPSHDDDDRATTSTTTTFQRVSVVVQRFNSVLHHCHALWRSCIRCVGPKDMESAAGAFTGTRDRWLLQDGVEDLSSLHPVDAANCLDTTRPCNDFHVTAR